MRSNYALRKFRCRRVFILMRWSKNIIVDIIWSVYINLNEFMRGREAKGVEKPNNLSKRQFVMHQNYILWKISAAEYINRCIN